MVAWNDQHIGDQATHPRVLQGEYHPESAAQRDMVATHPRRTWLRLKPLMVDGYWLIVNTIVEDKNNNGHMSGDNIL